MELYSSTKNNIKEISRWTVDHCHGKVSVSESQAGTACFLSHVGFGRNKVLESKGTGFGAIDEGKRGEKRFKKAIGRGG